MEQSRTMRSGRPVIIDTDGGADDLLALMLALRSPELAIEAITTVNGRVRSDDAVEKAQAVLELAGGAVPPIVRGYDRPVRRQVAEAGTGRSVEAAAVVILEAASANPDRLTLVTLGPLTNIAAAIQRDRRAMSRTAGIVMMGGAVLSPGNVTPFAEFNVFIDPEAADIVLTSGIPIVMIGLQVTRQVVLHRNRIDRSTSKLAGCIYDAVGGNGGSSGAGDSFCLHDPLAVGVAVDPSFTDRVPAHIDVELQSSDMRGMTTVSTGRGSQGSPNVQLAMHVDGERFVDFFLSRVVGQG